MGKVYANAGVAVKTHPQSLFFLMIGVMHVTMLFIIGLDAPPWGDEGHFLVTIRYFGQHVNFDTIRDYDQVTGPLFYTLYALWGKLTGFETAHLRQLSILFSIMTFTVLFQFYNAVLSSRKTALVAVCILLLNPYMWGLSFFVFTDISTLCFTVLMVWALYRKKTLLLFAATAAALLCRQYSVFVVVAAGIYVFIHICKGDRFQWGLLCALILACIPLMSLIFIWKGVAPPSGVKRFIVEGNQLYHYNYITAYITFMTLYLLPVIMFFARRLFRHRTTVLGAGVLSGAYIFFPVKASHVAFIQKDLDTIGLMHRLIRCVIVEDRLEALLLWGFFLCGLVVLVAVIREDLERFQRGIWDFGHFLSLTVLCFLIIMPFSYNLWEKYLVLVLPFMMLRLMMPACSGAAAA